MIRIKDKELLSSLFILFVFLTICTKLRFYGSIDLGSIGLIMLCFFSFFYVVKYNVYTSLKSNILLIYWSINLLILTFGYIYASYIKLEAPFDSVFHDILAYFLILIVIFIYSVFNILKISLIYVIEKYLFHVIILLTIFTLYFYVNRDSSDFFYYSSRYSFLSNNPNQFALFLTVLPFLCFYFYKYSSYRTLYSKENTIASIFFIFIIAIQTQSEALILSYIIGFTSIFTLVIIKKRHKIILSIGIVVLLLIIFNFNQIITYEYGIGQIYERFLLIENGFNVFLHSPVVGLGPGPHSFDSVIYNREAHNIIIDILTQSGIIGLLLFFYIVFIILKRLFQKEEFILIGALIALLVFSMFHYPLRHPVFWLYIFIFFEKSIKIHLLLKSKNSI